MSSTPTDLEAIAKQMQSGLTIKDRTFRLRRYTECFVGSEAVEWMISSGVAGDIDEAVALGNKLMAARAITIEHVTRGHVFKNAFLFYRFRNSTSYVPLHILCAIPNYAVCGFLLKRSNHTKTWRERYFVLEGKRLTCYKELSNSLQTNVSDWGSTMLNLSLIAEFEDKEKSDSAFCISQAGQKIMMLRASGSEHRDFWVTACQSANAAKTDMEARQDQIAHKDSQATRYV